MEVNTRKHCVPEIILDETPISLYDESIASLGKFFDLWRTSAKAMMEEWIYSAQRSNLAEYHNCANTLLNWQKGILNSFEVPYTNGFTE